MSGTTNQKLGIDDHHKVQDSEEKGGAGPEQGIIGDSIIEMKKSVKSNQTLYAGKIDSSTSERRNGL